MKDMGCQIINSYQLFEIIQQVEELFLFPVLTKRVCLQVYKLNKL